MAVCRVISQPEESIRRASYAKASEIGTPDRLVLSPVRLDPPQPPRTSGCLRRHSDTGTALPPRPVERERGPRLVNDDNARCWMQDSVSTHRSSISPVIRCVQSVFQHDEICICSRSRLPNEARPPLSSRAPAFAALPKASSSQS